VDATTAHGLPTQSGENEAAPDEEHGDGEPKGRETSREEVTSSAAEFEESGSADERTPEDPERMHGTPDLDPGGSSDETFQGVGPTGGQPAVEGDGGETTRADVVDRVAGKAAGSNARDDAKPEEASDDGARDATPESGTDAGTNEQRDSDASQPDLQDRWSTPPPQDAVDADEEQQGIVTQEVDSVPEILADSDADDLQEAEPPEPAYETKPDGRTLVHDESETDDRLEPNDASEDPHGREERDRPEAPSSREQGEPDTDETFSEEAEARNQVVDDADGELAPDEPEPVRASDDVDYRVDPSTNLEVAADEAMARATEAAQQEPAPRSPDREREILELREQIPDEAFRVRIENYVYTEVSRERLAKVIAEGRVFSLDAVATEDGEWMHPTEHPALESLRRKTADEAHRLLDAAPESQSREIDLDELEGSVGDTQRPPPVPDEPESGAESPLGVGPAVDGEAEIDFPDDAPLEESPPTSAESSSTPEDSELPRREDSSEGDRSNAPLVTLTVLLFVLAGAILVFSIRSSSESSIETEQTSPAASETTERASDSSGDGEDRTAGLVFEAISTASREVAHATDVDPSDPQTQDRIASTYRRNGEPRRASHILDVIWKERSDDPTFARRYLEVLAEAERWDRARSVAIESIQRFDSPAQFEKTYRETLENQPSLQQYRPIDLGSREDVRTIRPVDRGGLPAYAVYGPEGTTSFLLVPEAEGVRDWRDQIAAWRLCELLECGFEIPETRAAKIDSESFDQLFEPRGSESPAPERSALEWMERNDEKILRGAVRRWPANLERWPIEAVSLWRPWISGYVDDVPWNTTVAEALEDRPDTDIEPAVREQIRSTTGSWTVRRTARQLSNVLTYDYLTNNWGRFQEKPETYGASHHVGSEWFVTVRSGTVFQNRGSRRVEDRFNWTNRFSEDFLTSLRLLERDRAASILYPTPTGITDAKLRIFWRQRKRVLNRVDHLAGKSSRDKIVFFE